MDSAQRFIERNRARRSRQEALDEAYCRPGYTYNETLDRCLPAAGGAEIAGESDIAVQKLKNEGNLEQIQAINSGATERLAAAAESEKNIAKLMAGGGMESIPEKSPANEAVAKEVKTRKM